MAPFDPFAAVVLGEMTFDSTIFNLYEVSKTWIGDGKGDENGEGRRRRGELWYPPLQERSKSRKLGTAIPHDIISIGRRWRLEVASSLGQVASSFERKIRRLPDDVVPKGEQGIRDGRRETVTGTGAGAGAGTGGRTSAAMSQRVGMRARTGAGTGRGGKESGNLRIGYRGGSGDTRRGSMLTSNQSTQLQDPTPQRGRRIMLRTRVQGREAWNRSGRSEERRGSARDPRRVIDAMWETDETWAGTEKNLIRKS